MAGDQLHHSGASRTGRTDDLAVCSRLASAAAGVEPAHKSARGWKKLYSAKRAVRNGRENFGAIWLARPLQFLLPTMEYRPRVVVALRDRAESATVAAWLDAKGFEPGEEITIGGIACDLYPVRQWE